MMDFTKPVGGVLPLEMPSLAPPVPAAAGPDFAHLLREAIDHVEQFQRDGRQSVDRFLSGENDEVHDVVMATQRADLAFDMFLQVRNKVVQAYQEIMRMQV